MSKLEEKQTEIIQFIEKYSEENGFSPSVRELSEFAGEVSTSTMHLFLKKLVDRDVIRMQDNKSRTISVVKKHGQR